MKLGITMEGGASRTVFSCGVADAFLEEGIMPDYFIGVSAGIAYGVSYLSKQKGRNLTIIQKYMNVYGCAPFVKKQEFLQHSFRV